MQIVSRIPLEAAEPVAFELFLDHLRVDGAEAHHALAYADAARAEVEAYCGLALFHQDVTAITGRWPGKALELPIGPANDPAHVTVELVEQDGTLTPITEGWTFTPGRYPSLAFDAEPAGPLRITWRAGFGTDPMHLPRDLHHAVMDQALRLYDRRGDVDAPATLCPSAARICARYRRVKVHA